MPNNETELVYNKGPSMASLSSRHFKVRYQGHLLNTVVTGWHSILDLRAHLGTLVGLPAYHIQIFVCGVGNVRTLFHTAP